VGDETGHARRVSAQFESGAKEVGLLGADLWARRPPQRAVALSGR